MSRGVPRADVGGPCPWNSSVAGGRRSSSGGAGSTSRGSTIVMPDGGSIAARLLGMIASAGAGFWGRVFLTGPGRCTGSSSIFTLFLVATFFCTTEY